MYLDKIQIGSKVAPLNGLTVGFGVVTNILHLQQPDLRSVYEVLTDFGNILKFTENEFTNYYTNEIYYKYHHFDEVLLDSYATDNLETRINDQILNLQMTLEVLKERGTI